MILTPSFPLLADGPKAGTTVQPAPRRDLADEPATARTRESPVGRLRAQRDVWRSAMADMCRLCALTLSILGGVIQAGAEGRHDCSLSSPQEPPFCYRVLSVRHGGSGRGGPVRHRAAVQPERIWSASYLSGSRLTPRESSVLYGTGAGLGERVPRREALLHGSIAARGPLPFLRQCLERDLRHIPGLLTSTNPRSPFSDLSGEGASTTLRYSRSDLRARQGSSPW